MGIHEKIEIVVPRQRMKHAHHCGCIHPRTEWSAEGRHIKNLLAPFQRNVPLQMTRKWFCSCDPARSWREATASRIEGLSLCTSSTGTTENGRALLALSALSAIPESSQRRSLKFSSD